MRNFFLLALMLSASAAAQEPAAPAKEPTPPPPAAPPPPITITPDMLPNLLSRPWIVTLPVSGECVIPLKQMPIPPGTKYSGEKVAPGPGNVDKMPMAAGLPICGVPQPK